MSDEKVLERFSVEIFPGHRITGDALAHYTGTGDQWQQYDLIKLPGFDGSQTIDLRDFWHTVFQQQPTHYQVGVTGRETIVKWSDTQQLTEAFTLVAELSYR